MKKRYGIYDFVLPMVFLCIALLGISYSSWVHTNQVVFNIRSSSMNYHFGCNPNEVSLIHPDGSVEALDAIISLDDNKLLQIQFPNGAKLLELTCGQDILRLQYTLEAENRIGKNIALKPADQKLDDITINLDSDSVTCRYMGMELPAYDYSSLLPDNLGTYQVYHKFDGIAGKIDLLPIQLPVIQTVKLKKSRIRMEKTQKIQGKNEDLEARGDADRMIIRGTYCFSIPLDFNQFNAE